MFDRVRWRLTAWYVAVLLLIVAGVTTVSYVVFARALRSEVDHSLRVTAANVAAQLSRRGPEFTQGSTVPQERPRHEEHEDDEEENEDDGEVQFFTPQGGDVFYLVLAPDGATLLNPLNVQMEGLPDTAAAQDAAAGGDAWRTLREDGTQYRLYSLAVQHEDRVAAVVQVGRSLAAHDRQLRTLLLVSGATGAGGLALAAVGGLFLAGRALVPVRQAFERQRKFVADASHELRTPLTLFRAGAEVLQRDAAGRLPPEDQETLTDIIRESDHMARLVNDLLTLARLDEGRLELAREPLDLAGVLQEVAEQGRRLAGGRDLRIEADASGPLPVEGDRTRLRQLLLALVDNAVRHTPDGGRVRLSGRIARGWAEVQVADTGPGIPPEHLPHVFERFYRAEPSRSRAMGGTGLGLSIARGIAQAHGGRLTAASPPGQGAVFTLTLKARPAALSGDARRAGGGSEPAVGRHWEEG